MIPIIAFVLVFAHFVADFVCQTDWMAQNKSKQWDALGVHVLVYTGITIVIVGTSLMVLGHTDVQLGKWVVTNAVAHFVTDAVTSRINKRLWDAKEVHYFFVSIGADQMIHYFTLFYTANLWLV